MREFSSSSALWALEVDTVTDRRETVPETQFLSNRSQCVAVDVLEQSI